MSLVNRLVRRGCVLNKRPLPTCHGVLGCKKYHLSPMLLGADVYTDHELAAAAQEDAKSLPFSVRHIELTTSRILNGVKTKTNEMKFNVAYVDTHPGADASVPTVVTLHGTPGSHLDFKHVINGLPKHNMRVVALNFPGFNWTPLDSKNKFEHTTSEKTAFLEEFLKSKKLSKVDVLVSHSSGSYPAASLCTTTSLVQSLLFINPNGHRFMKSIKPWWYLKTHAKYCRIPVLRPLMLAIFKLGLIMIDLPNKDALLMSAAIETIAKFNYTQQVETMKDLNGKKFPIFVMYSKDDQGVETAISHEFAMMLGGSPAVMQHYSSQLEVTHPAANEGDAGEHIFRGYVFEKGGHFLMKRYPDIVNQAIIDLHSAVKQRNA